MHFSNSPLVRARELERLRAGRRGATRGGAADRPHGVPRRRRRRRGERGGGLMRPLALLVMLLVAQCNQSMKDQHRALPNGTTDAWESGATARPAPGRHGRTGRDCLSRGAATTARSRRLPSWHAVASATTSSVRSATAITGRGDGMVVQRGYPRPPSLLAEQAKALSAQELMDAITKGRASCSPTPPRSRRATAGRSSAYIRALQRAVSPHRRRRHELACWLSPCWPCSLALVGGVRVVAA